MNRILILAAGFFAAIVHGQCTITGDSSIKTDQAATFSVDSDGNCNDCYYWTVSQDSKLKASDSKSNQILVTALETGKASLSVKYEKANATVKCQKTIEIVNPDLHPADQKCGVTISDFKDVKVNDKVISFFPNEDSSEYSYQWTVNYANGETKDSTEKIPQFTLSEVNYITSVKLRITKKSPICTLAITKKFDQDYWKPSSSDVGKVEQRTYKPGSYSDYLKSSSTTPNKDQ